MTGRRLGASVLLAAGTDLLPLALLVVAAVVRPSRLPILFLLAVGAGAASRVDRRRLPAWAGALPVAVSLAWGTVGLPPVATDGSTCSDPAAPFAMYRLAEAILALGAVVLLARVVGGGGEELGLRRPSSRAGAFGVASLAICGLLGVVIGPALSTSFFGRVVLDTHDPAALVPALVFAVSNGVMEEVVYRGSLRAWTSRVTGPWPAIVGQAIVFGIAHSGPDFAGSPVPVALAMAAGGLIAALIVRRTGSLFLPIMIHVGLDISLFYGNACRIR